LVGVSLGRLRFGHGFSRVGSLILGWVGAIALHTAFNNAIRAGDGLNTLLFAVGIGLGGVALTVGFIMWGLSEERRWLKQTLGLDVGVSSGESAVIQKMADLDILIQPIGERFGEEKKKQVATFLQLQAQLGLKRKVHEMTTDARLRDELSSQITTLRQDMDMLRRDVGVYCMTYVRSILPPETEPIWDRLGQTLAALDAEPPKRSLWSSLGDKMESSSEEDS
jgi:hypothetical protein